MAKARSPTPVQKSVPPPADKLRDDLDILAARIVARSLGESPPGNFEASLDAQIDALKVTAAYWAITRKGASSTTLETESAYEEYRKRLNPGARNGAADLASYS